MNMGLVVGGVVAGVVLLGALARALGRGGRSADAAAESPPPVDAPGVNDSAPAPDTATDAPTDAATEPTNAATEAPVDAGSSSEVAQASKAGEPDPTLPDDAAGRGTGTLEPPVAPRAQRAVDEDIPLAPPGTWSAHVSIEGDELDGRTAEEIVQAHADSEEGPSGTSKPPGEDEEEHDADTLFADQDVWEAEHDAAFAAAAFSEERVHRVSDDLDLVRDGGYGVGSAAPLPEGVQPLGHPVKGVRDGMVFHEPGGTAYLDVVADVWFTDAEAAQRCGFHRVEG